MNEALDKLKAKLARESQDEKHSILNAKEAVVTAAAKQGVTLTLDDVYCQEFHELFGFWRAIIKAPIITGVFYEVLYNGNTMETRVNTYQLMKQVVIPD